MSSDAPSGWVVQEFGGLLDEFDLDEHQRLFVRARWLDQMAWFDAKAKLAQRRYYALRLVAIVGGLIVPALVSLDIHNNAAASSIAWTTFGLSLVVGIAVAVDGFFNYGGRWRQYRRTSELLKGQGWQYFELIGVYSGYPNHRAAFPRFAAAIEALIAEDVEAYLSKVMREQQKQDGQPEEKQDASASSQPMLEG